MAYHFFAMVSRMKYIDRWALMRNTRQENLTEHSHEVAVIAHALAVLRNRRFGGHVDAARAALLGLYHDLPETLTGDGYDSYPEDLPGRKVAEYRIA